MIRKNIEHSRRESSILKILFTGDANSSSAIRERLLALGERVSLVTIKRALASMVKNELLTVRGAGRSVSYGISAIGRIFFDIDAHEYCATEPDKRFGMNRYVFDLFAHIPDNIFTASEIGRLEQATAAYQRRTEHIPPAIEKKELERLIIELSWKSSRIEGNTYTLLDTERLILENREAPGHDHVEAQMILNHKEAFAFIREHAVEFRTLSRANLEMLHAVLVKDMGVGLGIRKNPVGVVGSIYRPLDNIHQLAEGIDELSSVVSRMTTPYAKALIALLGISYLQPFTDGNKRTSRLFANAILLAHGRAPLSYRSVSEDDYREATLVFYELNSIVPLKKIFIEQYSFSANNYAVR